MLELGFKAVPRILFVLNLLQIGMRLGAIDPSLSSGSTVGMSYKTMVLCWQDVDIDTTTHPV